MATTPDYGAVANSMYSAVSKTTTGGATFTYGSNNFNAPSVTSSPANTTSDYSKNNPYYGQTATHSSAEYAPTASYTGGTSGFAAGGVDYGANNPYYGQSTASTAPAEEFVSAYVGGTPGFQAGTVQYGDNYTPQIVEDRYANYLQREYDSQGMLPVNAAGQTAYDLQRGQINQQFEDDYTRRQEAIRRAMAAQGMGGSGVEAKLLTQALQGVEAGKGGALSNVGIEELQAIERRQSRLGTQAFDASEASKGREVTRELTYAGLTMQEQQLAETARQFDNEQDFNAWATKAGLDDKTKERIWQANQNDKDRFLKGELTYADLSMREQELAEDARQFDNKIDFDAWATQMQLDDNAKERLWQAVENQNDRFLKGELTYADLSQRDRELYVDVWKFGNEQAWKTWAKSMDIDDNQAERVWQSRENDIQGDREISQIVARTIGEMQSMGYEDVLAKSAEDRKVESEYYHNLGAVGGLDEAKLAELEKSKPTAYMAYKAGEAGKSVEEANQEIEMRDKFISAMISSFDPAKDGAFRQNMVNMASALGIDLGDLGQTGTGTGTADSGTFDPFANTDTTNITPAELTGGNEAGSPNYQRYQQVYQNATQWIPTFTKNKSGSDAIDIGNMPQGYFKDGNGDLYHYGGEDPSEQRVVGGINYTKYPVIDVATGKQVWFVARGLERNMSDANVQIVK